MHEKCWGQMINREKSSVMFSANARSNAKNLLLQALEIGSEVIEKKYFFFENTPWNFFFENTPWKGVSIT
jgi:hypothetical protein